MNKTTELTCIRCPIGCLVSVTADAQGNVMDIRGNGCPNGSRYAASELVNPVRIVTSTVRVEGGELPVAPVKTKTDIPKGRVFDCMEAINRASVKAPVRIGDVVIADVLGLGVDVVATRDVGEAAAEPKQDVEEAAEQIRGEREV
ncbi:DUF1667 domain-containing protein [Lachnoclostridium sp. Marseille-P6806]|uniref:DUF1667 domain-containing protein n=1 Tax=Lachnoclostridium sp. Marseille-P6806 TaxID=2364793 RepID=UPI0010300F69|nr:DUF1667 domain-containing protein [Lachnoclostridium sp. Marseille-P6806]